MANLMNLIPRVSQEPVCGACANVPLDIADTDDLSLYRKVHLQTVDSVLITDLRGIIQYVNPGFEALTGYAADEVVGQYPRVFKSGKHDAIFYTRFWNILQRGKVFHGVLVNRRKNGTLFHEEKTVSPIRDNFGKITHYVSTGRDVSARIAAEQALFQHVHRDSLTALQNRKDFLGEIEQARQRASYRDDGFSIMLLGVDNLKNVNDVLGHEAGDQAIQLVGYRLAAYLEGRGVVAHWGGDEFALLIDGREPVEVLETLAKQILDCVSDPLRLGEQTVFLTACVGTAVYPADANDPADLVRHVNLAMHRAKAAGPNSSVFYCKSMRDAIETSFLLEGALHGALQRNEFHLVFQPVVDSASRQMIAVEALLRWQSSTHGLVSPDCFIPLLEHDGLIVPVGRWVMRTACLHVMLLGARCDRLLRLAVNVSARQLLHPEFFDDVNGALAESGLAAARLELEITESVLIENAAAADEILRRLRARGVRIATDDFGTGYSSLTYLRRFPINTLKIDKSFVAELKSSADAAAIIRAIIRLAQDLGLEIVAEGVETAGQAQLLTELGCSYLQGYLFSRPVSIDQLPLQT